MNFRFDPLQALGRKFSSALGHNSPIINALRPFYEAALHRYHGDRGIPWTINDVPYRIDPHYRQLMGQNWDPEVAAFLRERLKPGALCLDVGANAGVYVLQFCHWTAPNGHVIAFEPNPITREILQAHIRMNSLQDRVEITPFAVSDTEGESEFHFAGASGMSRLGGANTVLASSAQKTNVATTTLDAFCSLDDLRPDWLLMDIEGYELHALRGARGLFSRCPAMQIIVEMHPSLWAQSGVTVYHWQTFLRDENLRLVPLSGQNDPLAELGSVYLQRK